MVVSPPKRGRAPEDVLRALVARGVGSILLLLGGLLFIIVSLALLIPPSFRDMYAMILCSHTWLFAFFFFPFACSEATAGGRSIK